MNHQETKSYNILVFDRTLGPHQGTSCVRAYNERDMARADWLRFFVAGYDNANLSFFNKKDVFRGLARRVGGDALKSHEEHQSWNLFDGFFGPTYRSSSPSDPWPKIEVKSQLPADLGTRLVIDASEPSKGVMPMYKTPEKGLVPRALDSSELSLFGAQLVTVLEEQHGKQAGMIAYGLEGIGQYNPVTFAKRVLSKIR